MTVTRYADVGAVYNEVVFETIPVPFNHARTTKGLTIMAEDQMQQPGQEQLQLVLDEREMRTNFANAYRIHHTAEEVVLDFGFNMANPNPQGGQQQQLLFKVNERVIMSYPSVKRLTMSLQQLIKRYEQQFGEIATQPGPRK
jgi:hypothetical protein